MDQKKYDLEIEKELFPEKRKKKDFVKYFAEKGFKYHIPKKNATKKKKKK